MACVFELYPISRGGIVVGGAVGFHLVVLLLPSDDNIAGIPADINDGAEVVRGVAVEVALPALVLLDYTVLAFSTLCIPELAVVLLDVIFMRI